MKNKLKLINMTEEEIKTKAKEIAQNNGRTYRDQDYGDINTEEECYNSAMEIANWVVEHMNLQKKFVNIPAVAYITDDNRLSISADLNTLKGYETLKNGIKNSSDIALVQQALDKARDLANTIEGALAGEEPYPDTYYRMCQEIIETLTKINYKLLKDWNDD